jgi:hypothetical protein
VKNKPKKNKKKSKSDGARKNDTKTGTLAPTNNKYRVRF